MRMPVWILMFGMSLWVSLAYAASEVSEPEKLRQQMGVTRYQVSGRIQDLKVAVLDNGFAGYVAGKRQLPDSAEVVNPTQIAPAPTSHGLVMAQVLWAITGKNAQGPKFYLINSNGFSNFKGAVQYVIDQKIDIVLYSQVWPFGGNFDGKGFINAEVTRAVQNGVIWINAAGNNGGMVFNGKVMDQSLNSSGNMVFSKDGSARDYLRFNNPLDENEVTLTLSWSDFTDSEDYNTNKDLNLFVYDESGNLVGKSELIQRGQAPSSGDATLSSHARESVTLKNLDRGNYRIKIKRASNNFSRSDALRLVIKSAKGVEFTDHSDGQEIMPPADNPLVITVGEKAEFSAKGPTADGRKKPDVLVSETHVAFTNGEQVDGSSAAAAMVAGAVAVMKADTPRITAEQVRRYASKFSSGSASIEGDLRPVESREEDSSIRRLVPQGGWLMVQKTRGHYVIMVPWDPFLIQDVKNSGFRRQAPDDIVIYHPQIYRWYVVPKYREDTIVPPWVEYRQIQPGAPNSGIWATPSPEELRRW